jgi:hypothetical protein
MGGPFVQITTYEWSGSSILGVCGINFPFGELACTTCMGGAFVDTHFHAHCSRHHNTTKQTRFPTIWGGNMNGQLRSCNLGWFSSVSTPMAVISRG